MSFLLRNQSGTEQRILDEDLAVANSEAIRHIVADNGHKAVIADDKFVYIDDFVDFVNSNNDPSIAPQLPVSQEDIEVWTSYGVFWDPSHGKVIVSRNNLAKATDRETEVFDRLKQLVDFSLTTLSLADGHNLQSDNYTVFCLRRALDFMRQYPLLLPLNFNIDGHKQGSWSYNRNGAIERIFYLNGVAEGSTITVYDDTPNLQTVVKGQYLHGKSVGDWKYYHGNGQLKIDAVYSEATGRLLSSKTYYPNGQPETDVSNTTDATTGSLLSTKIVYSADDSGIQSIKNYRDNVLDGDFESNEDIHHIVGSYHKGELDGDYSDTRIDTGEVIKEGRYDNGKKVGVWQENLPPLIHSKGEYVNDKREGEWIGKNGNFVRIDQYHNGALNGLSSSFEDGIIQSEIEYKNNKLHGVKKEYKQGKLYSQAVYRDGDFKNFI